MSEKKFNKYAIVEEIAGYPKVIPHKNAVIEIYRTLNTMFFKKGGFRGEEIHETCIQLLRDDVNGSTKIKMNQTLVFGKFHFVNIWDADVTREVLFLKDEVIGKQDFGQEITQRLTGDSIISVEGEEWKRQKRILSPAFNSDHLRFVVPEINDVASKLVDLLRNNSKNDQVIEIHPIMQRVTLDMIGRAGFRVSFDTVNNEKSYKEMVYNELIEDLQKSIHMFPLLDRVLGSKDRVMKKFEKFESFILEIVENKRKLIAENENYEAKDILDLLILAHDSEDGLLTDTQLMRNLNTFFIAGHETTAAAVSSTLHFLAENQDCQSKLHHEIMRICGTSSPSYDQLKDFDYTQNCIKEAIRLFPPAPLLMRKAKVDTVINHYFIPANSTIAFFPYTMHRDPQYWNNPDKYDPDRFSSENKDQRHRYAYIPFSIGPRQCIGNNLAMMEMKIILIHVLQHFHVNVNQNSDVKFAPYFGIVTQPPPRCTLLFTPRF